jgi:hypothetical protein
MTAGSREAGERRVKVNGEWAEDETAAGKTKSHGMPWLS